MASKDVLVIMGASGIQGTMSEYVLALSSAGIPVYIENLAGAPWLNRGGRIGEKVETLRALVQRFADYRYLVLSDGFDVNFFGTRESLLARMPNGYVIQAAEKNYYPDSGQRDQIPDRGPWRYANGGLSVGSPDAYWKWCDAVVNHPRYDPTFLDQGFMNLLLAEQSPFMHIDFPTNLFFCLFGGYEELEFVNGEPVNRLYDTWPLFVHANGKWPADEMFRRYHESLEGTIPS